MSAQDRYWRAIAPTLALTAVVLVSASVVVFGLMPDTVADAGMVDGLIAWRTTAVGLLLPVSTAAMVVLIRRNQASAVTRRWTAGILVLTCGQALGLITIPLLLRAGPLLLTLSSAVAVAATAALAARLAQPVGPVSDPRPPTT